MREIIPHIQNKREDNYWLYWEAMEATDNGITSSSIQRKKKCQSRILSIVNTFKNEGKNAVTISPRK